PRDRTHARARRRDGRGVPAPGRPARRRDAPLGRRLEDGGLDQPRDRRAARLRRAHGRAQAPLDPTALGRRGRSMSTRGAVDDSDLPATLVEVLERVCDRFEAACKAGGRPRIEDYLREMPESGRSSLARELAAIERAYSDWSGGETLPTRPDRPAPEGP